MLATYHGHLPLSQYLISKSADPNLTNDKNQTPLAGAIFKGEDEIVKLLLEKGADLDLGEPSARQALEMFKMKDRYAKWVEEADSRGTERS
jgi:uncharacterized protein